MTLPAPISTYLAAHREHDTTTAIAAFAADATVTDEGRTHEGVDQIRAWMEKSSGEFTYTTSFVSASRDDAGGWDVVQHLEGDFPGGEVDLHFRFALEGDRIARLVIEP